MHIEHFPYRIWNNKTRTIIKPLYKAGGQNNEYSRSSDEILVHQIYYSAEAYKKHAEI